MPHQKDKEKALKEISEKMKQVYALISECENLADQTGVDFSMDVAYGMGGYYVGKNSEDWDESDTGRWNPSSQSC